MPVETSQVCLEVDRLSFWKRHSFLACFIFVRGTESDFKDLKRLGREASMDGEIATFVALALADADDGLSSNPSPCLRRYAIYLTSCGR